MNTDWAGIYTSKECHKTESRWNHTTTDHKEGEELEDRKNRTDYTDKNYILKEDHRILSFG